MLVIKMKRKFTLPTDHTVVVVAADQRMIATAADALGTNSGYRVIVCNNEHEAKKRLEEVEAHLILCDVGVIKDDDSNLLISSRISHPLIPRVVVADVESELRGAEIARRVAAYLYLVKPVSDDLIRLVAKRALELSELYRRHRLLSRELKISMDDDIFAAPQEQAVQGGWSQFEKLVYVSPKMAELCAEARQAARTVA